MELYAFDKELNFIGITDSLDSLRWVRRYYKSGEFEVHCPLTDSNLLSLARGNIIYKKGDKEAGYIEYRNLQQDTDGKETLVIKGKFLTSYLSRRIVWDTIVLIDNKCEDIMRSLVNQNGINPVISDRKIPNLILGSLNVFPEKMDYQVSYGNLADEIENISTISNLGYRICFNPAINKDLTFDVYKGLDRSVNQSVNPRCIFSKEFDNILTQEYTDSLNNYKNLCLVVGTGDGSERVEAIVGSSVGLERYEIFNDQKSLSDEDNSVIMLESSYMDLLIGKGNETLASTSEIQTFVNTLNLNSNLKYKIDFDLGDIVTIVSKKWGVTLDTRIVEIEEVYEENGVSVNATFGTNIPTLIDKIKSMNKQQTSSGGSVVTTANIDGGSF